jgi:tRNA threonylcarbamoyladenosine biosynthesis protein TsaB
VTTVGFDTSTAATSACVLRGDGEIFEHVPQPQRLTQPPGHSRELLPTVEKLMQEAGVGWGDVEAIAVGTGPGTFTGLRIGVATARALATAAQLPVHPVSSLAALAEAIDAPTKLPLIDARRGELFGALYEDGDLTVEPFAARPEHLAERLGRELAGAVAAGDGSLKFREFLEAAGVRVPPDDSGLHVVRALHVCRLAARVPGELPETVLPTYIRDPDAEPSQ